MKYLLFLTFFVLTLFVNAQDKMGFGNDPDGADSAGFGLVTTWVKPTPSTDTITYEGTLTVGEIGDLGYGYLFLRDLYVSGEVNPLFDGDYFGITIAYVLENTSLTVASIENSNASVPPFSTTTEIISFEINAVSYALTKTNLGEGHYEWLYFTETNPFPAVGETCTVKIIYTL